MRPVVERLEGIAREVNSQARIRSPYVHRFGHDSDGQDESVYVVVDVDIPADHDGTDFRDRFFDRLAEAIEPEDSVRLAVGVRCCA